MALQRAASSTSVTFLLIVRLICAQVSPERCILNALSQLNCNSTEQGPQSWLAKVLRDCLTDPEAQQTPVRVSFPYGASGPDITPFVKAFSSVTNIPVHVDSVTTMDWIMGFPAEVQRTLQRNSTHDGWMMAFSALVGDAAPILKTLTNVVALDSRLNWPGVLPVLRTFGLLYNSEVVGLPAMAYSYQMFYRKDIFSQYNLRPPRTWDELVSWTQQHNGTAGMHAFCGPWGPCQGAGAVMLWMIFASFVQTQGPTQGWVFDPNTMDLLFDTPAMAQALRIAKALYDWSAPDHSAEYGCLFYDVDFMQGKCLIVMHDSSMFKASSHTSKRSKAGPLHGNLGVMRPVGPTRVLDPTTKTLVPCDPTRCPHATQYSQSNGSVFWVNEAPFLDSNSFMFNAYSPPRSAFYAYSLLAYLSSEQINSQFVYDSNTVLLPTRTSQLNPAPWIATGWNANDTYEFLASYKYSVNHPNVQLLPTMPGAMALINCFGLGAGLLLAGVPAPNIIQQMVAMADSALAGTYGANKTALKASYWASLNRATLVAASPPPVSATPPAERSASDTATGSGPSQTVVAVAVVLPVCIVAAGLLILQKRRGWLFNSKQRTHPGPGPATTLCVTDIESSTLLWEEIDPLVMDISAKLHNGCIRDLAAKHDGYESVWEGDSFIIAFHHPSEALAFCMEVQQQLLHLPWPSDLLQSPHAKEVWCTAAARAAAKSPQPGQKADADSTGNLHLAEGLIPVAATSQPATASCTTHYLNLTMSSLEGQRQGSTPSATLPLGDDIQSCSQGDEPDLGDLLFSLNGLLAQSDTSPSLRGSSGSMPATVATLHNTVGHAWQKAWIPCAFQTPGAILAYRGLRVRLGIHAGVDGSTAVTFNSTMQRYHYTGPVRVISNAVASAGHGGHTLITTDTAALLDTANNGVLKLLPGQCGVYHQGQHKLAGVEQPIELLLVLPDSLKCRLGLQQAPLRSDSRTVPGVLQAPLAGTGSSLAVVFTQFTGLDTLLAWSPAETVAALRSARACVLGTLSSYGGTVFEDGLCPVIRHKAMKVGGAAFPNQWIAGRMAMVVPGGSRGGWWPAVQFAVALRQALASLDWNTALLEHDLCSAVNVAASNATSMAGGGMAGAGQQLHRQLSTASSLEPSTALISARSSVDPGASLEADSGQSVVLSQAPVTKSPASRQTASAQGSLEPGVLDMIVDNKPPSSRSGIAKSPKLQRRNISFLRQSEASSCSSTAGPHAQQSPHTIKDDSSVPSGRVYLGDGSVRTTSSQVPSQPPALVPSASRPKSKHLLADWAGRFAPGDKGMPQYATLEPCMLRGLRTRMVVVSADSIRLAVATQSSGRVVYTGPSTTAAVKMLSKAKAAQILVEQTLVAQSLQPGCAPTAAALTTA